MFSISVKKITLEDQMKRATDKMIDSVALSIGRNYFIIGIELGLTVKELEILRMNNYGNAIRSIQCMLRQWSRKFKEEATVGRFVSAMIDAECDIEQLDYQPESSDSSSVLVWNPN